METIRGQYTYPIKNPANNEPRPSTLIPRSNMTLSRQRLTRLPRSSSQSGSAAWMLSYLPDILCKCLVQAFCRRDLASQAFGARNRGSPKNKVMNPEKNSQKSSVRLGLCLKTPLPIRDIVDAVVIVFLKKLYIGIDVHSSRGCSSTALRNSRVNTLVRILRGSPLRKLRLWASCTCRHIRCFSWDIPQRGRSRPRVVGFKDS